LSFSDRFGRVLRLSIKDVGEIGGLSSNGNMGTHLSASICACIRITVQKLMSQLAFAQNSSDKNIISIQNTHVKVYSLLISACKIS